MSDSKVGFKITLVLIKLNWEDSMIDLYYWPTPNGHKIARLLEETQLAYRLHPVNINLGEQRTAEYLSIAPNNKIPAIVDDTPHS